MMRLDRLPNQRQDEKVALFIRRHWFAPFTIAAIGILLFIAPFVLWIALSEAFTGWFAHPIIGPLLGGGLAIYLLGVWLVCWIEFTDYYLDTWIVSNERIINIEQAGLFNRTASELHLANVQDVTSEIRGFLHTMFNYGDVVVQTAGETVRFNFKNVPNPEHIKNAILVLVEQDKRRHSQEQK